MLTQPELKQQLLTCLHEIGLKDQEMDLYTHSLVLGPSSTAVLGQHLGLKTQNVYRLIEALEKHGLARSSEHQKYGKKFIVESPSVLVDLLEKRRADIERSKQQLKITLPDLLTSYHQGNTPTKVRILKGQEQYIQTLHRLVFEAKEEMFFFGSMKDFVEFITPQGFEIIRQARAEHGVSLRSIMLPSEIAHELKRLGPKEKRLAKILKTKPPFITSFLMTQHRAVIFQPEAALALQIEDEQILLMLRSVFETVWASIEE